MGAAIVQQADLAISRLKQHQVLADEDLVTSEDVSGKKVFSLTDEGRALVAKTAEAPAPWEEAAETDGFRGYREAAGRLLQAAWQVGKTGS